MPPPLETTALTDPLAAPSPAAQPEQPPELLLVGRLVAAQGLSGELRVLPLSDFPERFTRPGRRWLQRRGESPQVVTLRSGRQLPGRELFVVRLAGIDNRSAAEALVGHELLVPAAERPALAPGEFHLLDLVGLEVRLLSTQPHGAATEGAGSGLADNAETAAIGRVVDLIHAGNDLLEVELSAAEGIGRGRRVLIPFVEAIVPEVNLREGWIGLTPPAGLLEL